MGNTQMAFVSHKRRTSNVQRSTSNSESEFGLRCWVLGVFLNAKLRPHRRVVGWFFTLAHLAINPGRNAFCCQLFARQNCVNAQAAIFFERAHLIIPPTEEFAFLVMEPQRVAQADFA